MSIRESSYGYWSGTGIFVLVLAMGAVGIGNVTRLPALAAAHGGGLFTLCYLLALLLMGWPLLTAELLVGRWCRRSVVPGFERLALAAGTRPAWGWLGWPMLIGSMIVLSYTSVIAGWCVAYLPRAASGHLAGESTATLQAAFHHLALDPERSLAWHTLFMLMACIVVGHGIRDGLERASGYLFVAVALSLLGLLSFALRHGDPVAGVGMLLTPDAAGFGWRAVFEALNLAFFTVTAGFGVIYVYGGYVPGQWALGRIAACALGLIVAIGLLGSVAIAAILAGAGVTPASGLGLIFEQLPGALPANWSGSGSALLFYLLLAVVALASAIAMLEVITLHWMERARTTRVFAATSSAVVVWALGMITLLSFNVLRGVEFFGRSLFGWLQWFSTTLLAPLGALLLCVLVIRIIPAGLRAEIWGANAEWLRRGWEWLLRYPVRVLLALLLAYEFGLVPALISLWS